MRLPSAQTAGRPRRRIAEILEIQALPLLWLALAAFAVSMIGRAAEKLLWYDELVDLRVASLPRLRDVYAFYHRGLDTPSPTSPLLEHLALRWTANPEIAARLIYLLAFTSALGCVFLFLRRCYPVPYAVVACALLVTSQRVVDVAVEAHSGYALVFAGLGLALLCWQRSAPGPTNRYGRPLGLWLGLALACNAHSFALVLVLPFAFAEAVRSLPTRRFEAATWGALLLAPLGLVPVLHGQTLARQRYGPTFWARPDHGMALQSYTEVLFSSDILILGCIAVFLAFSAMGSRPPLEAAPLPGRSTRRFERAEWALALGLAGLPFLALPLSLPLHIYRTNYVLPFALGMAVLLGAVLAEAGAGRRLEWSLALAAGCLLVCGLRLGGDLLRGARALARPAATHERLRATYRAQTWVQAVERSSLPVVMGEPYDDVQFRFYGQAEAAQRVVTLVTPEIRRYPGAQTSQINLLLFGDLLGCRLAAVDPFLEQTPRFLLADQPEPDEWLSKDLLAREKDGMERLQFLGPAFERAKNHPSLFLVTAPGAKDR